MASKVEANSGVNKGSPKKRDRAAEVANTFEWLITAFVLAFVFRAFVMEAFRIPTGSMADTLKGAHFRLRCPQCGYKYEYGYDPTAFQRRQDTIPPGSENVPPTRCPSCGFEPYLGQGGRLRLPVANGDRILVLKCVYQFFEPQRWDVVVFKNPINPQENYIKRLIALPGETVEIIDGDVYIDGQIARKPAAVQRELWMPVYDHDYRPIEPHRRAFNKRTWQVPFDFDQSAWQIDPDNPARFELDSSAETEQVLTYGQAPSANDFRASYAYNYVRSQNQMPQCSDLMVRFFAKPQTSEGRIGISLGKYGVDYRAWIDFSGEMVLAKVSDSEETVLKRESIDPVGNGKYTRVQFANVDHRLVLQFGDKLLTHDLGTDPNAMGQDRRIEPHARIFGSGKLALVHAAVFRDTHYTGDLPQNGKIGRATENNPFDLLDDEFFVLGDNSPNSEDGRWWEEPQMCSKGAIPPRAGVVPRDYLVGKALFVYWPSGFEFPWPRPFKRFLLEKSQQNAPLRLLYTLVSLRWIPNVGQMRFIYGGTNGEQQRASANRGSPQVPAALHQVTSR